MPVHTLRPDVLAEIEQEREARKRKAAEPELSATHRINALEARIKLLEAAPSAPPLDEAFWTEVASALRSLIDVKFGRLLNQIESLANRIKALEAQPSLKYCGVYDPGMTYVKNSLVTYDGCLWIAKSATGACPGADHDQGRTWQLCVKRGRDGKDAR
jgi:hypothetical protein